jgi:large subunit ribosomal protein L25
MSNENEITVALRDRVGKGAARAVRREGLVPGVVYGGKLPPQPITITRRELERHVGSGAFFNTLYSLKTDDKVQQVLPRDLQQHVVTDVPLHVDFLRISEDAEIVISVPVSFVNEEGSPGLREGGVLNIVRFEIEVRCLANAIPEQIIAKLDGLEVGDSLHISAIALPDGVTPTIDDRDFTIATIAAPSVMPVEEVEELEGEVVEGLEGEEGEGVEGEEGAEGAGEGEGAKDDEG